MNWTNVKLIYKRELRDQLRDRRTLFTIAVLPVLLYPLMGTSFLQIAQFMKEHPTKIWVIGADPLTSGNPAVERNVPALIQDNRFVEDFCSEQESALLELELEETLSQDASDAIHQLIQASGDSLSNSEMAALRQRVQSELQKQGSDILVFFPADFAKEIAESELSSGDSTPPTDVESQDDSLEPIGPQMLVLVNSANDKSRIAMDRVDRILARWRRAIVKGNLEKKQVSLVATDPFSLVNTDIAADVSRRAAVWSKILPFVMLIWALTGAFYPAIDLCAGEKERGTLETLLSSPAGRSEIVLGKLFTIMSFSVTTALLNLISMGVTGFFIIKQFSNMGLDQTQFQIGPPPIFALGWLVLLLFPISALFSALSLAIAAFARSSKEGQYYLMPLLVLTLPLMMLPMLPAAELDLGTALIPVAGTLLLLRKLIEGQYAEVIRFVIPVLGVTMVCCLLSIRWAVNQFKNESVLFRESERFGLGLWLRHLVRDRGLMPTFGEAIMCGVLILVIRFFVNLMGTIPVGWSGFAKMQSVQLIAFVASPALMMAIMLTRSPRASLALNWPPLLSIPAAFLLAVFMNPAVRWFGEIVTMVYPASAGMKEMEALIGQYFADAPNVWVIILVIALVPAVCEELAFRGFILSGLRSSCHKSTAIVISSLFFGASHMLLQQSIVAFVIGCLIGYIAVQTRSLWPCIIFHFTNNALAVLSGTVDREMIEGNSLLAFVFEIQGEGAAAVVSYQTLAGVLGSCLAVGIIYWFYRLGLEPAQKADESNLLEDSTAKMPGG